MEDHRLANAQGTLAKLGAACGGLPHELIKAHSERAERTRPQQEMAMAIPEERDHLEEILPQAKQDPRIMDVVREMQRPLFYQVLGIEHCGRKETYKNGSHNSLQDSRCVGVKHWNEL